MNPPLIQRLRWDGTGQSADMPADRAVMARAMAYLFGAGATITLVLFVMLPRPEADTAGMLGTVAVVYAFGVGTILAFDRIPERAFPWIGAAGTVVITAGVYFRGTPTTAHAFFYLWPTFYSFYFFTRLVAILELAWIAVAYAVVLAARNVFGNPVEVWLITVGTLVVVGMLVAILRARIDRLVGRLADAARRDVLTGLLNRRGFDELFDIELERAHRRGRLLSLMVGDLDHFKEINDRFGHQAGDRALERASQVLQRKKRRIDTASRIGGEEFALIVPDTDEHRAYVVAERLRTAMREAFAGDPVPITISFGIASFPTHGDTHASLLHAADQALYAAKELGRDRSVIYNAEITGILDEAQRTTTPDEHIATVVGLAETLERDQGISRHCQTVAHYAKMTARELGLPPDTVERLHLAGILHDVGKIGISDAVLWKPAPLTDEELAEMRKHPEIGARILSNAHLDDIAEWVLAHHERPDGKGFPDGRKIDDIPLGARILSVADAYEAMTSNRVYRSARSHEEAQAELASGAGTQFDKRVVEAFLTSLRREGATV